MENFWDLWNIHKTSIYKSIYASVGNNMDAEDILANTMLKAALSFGNLKDPRKVKSWFFSIAKNATIDFYRKKRRELLTDDGNFDHLVSRYEEVSDNKIIIEQFLQTVPAEWRTIVVMNLHYNISAKKIAEMTGGSYQAIRKRLTRTYQKLSKLLSY